MKPAFYGLTLCYKKNRLDEYINAYNMSLKGGLRETTP